MSRYPEWALGPLLLCASLAGCVSGDAQVQQQPGDAAPPRDPNAPEDLEAMPGHISGFVVDTELIPIAEADVIVTPGDVVALTGPSGGFRIGPLDSGTYTVRGQKHGYSTVDIQVQVNEDKAAKVNLVLEPMASDVPYHETLIRTMYIICHVVLPNPQGGQILNAPCGAVDLVTGTTNTIDQWKFPFKIEKPGFASLVMEMTWKPQQFGKDGLLQLTYLGKAEVNQGGGVTVAGTVYGDSMANPFHAIIHAGNSYWRSGGKPVVFYPVPNETAKFEMLVAGGGGNTTYHDTAFFLEFRPTVYLTLFYNRQSLPDFSILPDS